MWLNPSNVACPIEIFIDANYTLGFEDIFNMKCKILHQYYISQMMVKYTCDFRRLRKEELELEVSLGYIVRLLETTSQPVNQPVN